MKDDTAILGFSSLVGGLKEWQCRLKVNANEKRLLIPNPVHLSRGICQQTGHLGTSTPELQSHSNPILEQTSQEFISQLTKCP